jgi:hypothetical protein
MYFLASQVNDVMQSLVEGQGNQSYQAYVELLLAEAEIKANPIVIIQDMVLFGIKTGKSIKKFKYFL